MILCFEYVYFINIFEACFVIIGALLLFVVILDYSFKIKQYMEKLAEDKVLETLAYTDPLTGIMNRTRYEEELKYYKEEKMVL